MIDDFTLEDGHKGKHANMLIGSFNKNIVL